MPNNRPKRSIFGRFSSLFFNTIAQGKRGQDGLDAFMLVFKGVLNGAQSRNRTDDLMLTMHVLYQLSYLGFDGIEFSFRAKAIARPDLVPSLRSLLRDRRIQG